MGTGDLAEAHRRLIECFTVASEIGFVELTGYCLGVAADIALAIDEPDEAGVLLGATNEAFDRIGATPQAHETARHDRVLAALDGRLGDLDGVLERGRALRPEAAVALALGLDARER